MDGWVAFVTGAGGGIGRATAIELHCRGATVVLVGRNEPSLLATRGELVEPGRADVLVADVRDDEAIEQAVFSTIARRGRLDVVVNNAAVHEAEWADQLDLGRWRDVLDTNVTGAFIVARHALPHMMRARAGSIVNVGSVASERAGAGGVAYTASKHAVVGLTRQLAIQYGHYGIRANCVCPGVVATEMSGGSDVDGRRAAFLRTLPVPRPADPAEIAQVVAFLASDAATYVTGSSWTVDGGFGLGHFRGGTTSPTGAAPGRRAEEAARG